jgi:Lon protease-like protein
MLANDVEISLFPLNVVLFPGMILPLHIFEERYIAMIRECLATDQTFGVVLARSSQAQAPNVFDLDCDDIHRIGTTARISAVENLKDGRMNLVAIGQDRFYVKDVHPSTADFLVGRVDPFPVDDDDDPQELEGLLQKLRPLVQRYIEHLGDASGENLADTVLPTEPAALAYLAGAALQGPLPNKQTILSARTMRSLISKTINVLDKEDQILAYMLRAYEAHQQVERLPFVDYSLN